MLRTFIKNAGGAYNMKTIKVVITGGSGDIAVAIANELKKLESFIDSRAIDPCTSYKIKM